MVSSSGHDVRRRLHSRAFRFHSSIMLSNSALYCRALAIARMVPSFILYMSAHNSFMTVLHLPFSSSESFAVLHHVVHHSKSAHYILELHIQCLELLKQLRMFVLFLPSNALLLSELASHVLHYRVELHVCPIGMVQIHPESRIRPIGIVQILLEARIDSIVILQILAKLLIFRKHVCGILIIVDAPQGVRPTSGWKQL